MGNGKPVALRLADRSWDRAHMLAKRLLCAARQSGCAPAKTSIALTAETVSKTKGGEGRGVDHATTRRAQMSG